MGYMAVGLTLAQLQQGFARELQRRGRASATILAYNKDIEQLVKYLENKKIVHPLEVRPALIEEFRDSMRGQSYTDKSISRKLNAIKTFFRWLVNEKVLENDPAAPVAHPKYVSPPPRLLTRMEYRALRDAARADVRISAIIELMLQTGLRIGEVSNLRQSDIEQDTIRIRAYESQPERIIPLTPSAKQGLEQYMASRSSVTNEHVFITKTGNPLLVRNIRSVIDRYFRDAGIDNAKVNDLRNTFIAHQLKEGVDLVTVSRVAGHKRLSTTEHYLDFIERKEAGRSNQLVEL